MGAKMAPLLLLCPLLEALLLPPHRPSVQQRVFPCRMGPPADWPPLPPPKKGDYVDVFCRGLNAAMEKTVVPQLNAYAQVREATPQGDKDAQEFFWSTVQSPPELPGRSRPVWLTIAASVPTALGWYGWYKFSVEEELFYDELRRYGRATGAGGYGTLILFSWCVIVGGLGSVAGIPGAESIIEVGAAWILISQVNLYLRVNQLVTEIEGEPPLYAWWALLPPPLDVVVGLRQVHFLAKYWCSARGDTWRGDKVAEEYFPFISAPRFTLRTFLRTPSLWFWFSKDWPDLELNLLAEPQGYNMSKFTRSDLSPASRRNEVE